MGKAKKSKIDIHRSMLKSLSKVQRKKDVTKQKPLIHNSDWDVLIVLDACRFDYFKKVCFDFLQGELKKVESPASDTFTWLGTVFKNRYDMTVYSSHPVLNSMGIVRGGYKASFHFKKIIDIWRCGWDKELGAVPPDVVNKEVLNHIKKGHWEGRNIIWYMQPHAPWIGDTKITGHAEDCNDKKTLIEIWNDIKNGLIPKTLLRKAYEDNVRLVLQNIAELIPHLNGKVIITADHGEWLGESGCYGHSSHSLVKELVEVPWFEVQ